MRRGRQVADTGRDQAAQEVIGAINGRIPAGRQGQKGHGECLNAARVRSASDARGNSARRQKVQYGYEEILRHFVYQV
jgi:hypothetical protein